MEALAGLGIIGGIIFLVILILLGILLPFSAYAAQKWAYRTYQETKKLNEKLSEIAGLLRASQPQLKATPEKPPTRGKMSGLTLDSIFNGHKGG